MAGSDGYSVVMCGGRLDGVVRHVMMLTDLIVIPVIMDFELRRDGEGLPEIVWPEGSDPTRTPVFEQESYCLVFQGGHPSVDDRGRVRYQHMTPRVVGST